MQIDRYCTIKLKGPYFAPGPYFNHHILKSMPKSISTNDIFKRKTISDNVRIVVGLKNTGWLLSSCNILIFIDYREL